MRQRETGAKFAWGARGREFESRHADQFSSRTMGYDSSVVARFSFYFIAVASRRHSFSPAPRKMLCSRIGRSSMHRRAAVAWLASVVVAACGGGGGGGDIPGAAEPGALAAAPSSNIAAWGDSLTPPFALNLQLLYPDRTIYDGGVIGQTSNEIAAREMADQSGRHAWITVLWYGQNNDDAPEQIKADIAASVAALAPGNSRFIVLSVVNKAKPSEFRGAPAYDTIIRLNSELAAAYPRNYLDVRSYLVSQYDRSNPQEVADFQNDVVPSSMRYDEIHMRDSGSALVAKKVKEFIDAKGW